MVLRRTNWSRHSDKLRHVAVAAVAGFLALHACEAAARAAEPSMPTTSQAEQGPPPPVVPGDPSARSDPDSPVDLIRQAEAARQGEEAEAAAPPPAQAGSRQGRAGEGDEQVTEPINRHNRLALASYRIDNWEAPNDETIFIESTDGRRYRANFMGPCVGLRFVQRIGFVTSGANTLDRFSGVVLPDGTRCMFREFQQLSTPRTLAEGDESAPDAPVR